jgi:IS4 transposase
VYYLNDNGQYESIDLIKIKNEIKQAEQRAIIVYIGQEKLQTRLIIEKVPQPIADEKRRKLKTDKQNKRKSLSKERLELCDLNVYITNTTEQQLPLAQVREYYSLRWQVEIIFKAWKSVYNIDKVKKMKIQRFKCIFYSTLILILLTTQLLNYCKVHLYKTTKEELSEFKMFKALKSILKEFKNAVRKTNQEIMEFLDLLQTMVPITCVKQEKKGRKTPYNIIKVSLA